MCACTFTFSRYGWPAAWPNALGAACLAVQASRSFLAGCSDAVLQWTATASRLGLLQEQHLTDGEFLALPECQHPAKLDG